jgi:hypothetical protein
MEEYTTSQLIVSFFGWALIILFVFGNIIMNGKSFLQYLVKNIKKLWEIKKSK